MSTFVVSGSLVTSGNVAVNGTFLSPNQIVSTQSTGAPFSIISTTLVPNLYVARSSLSDTVTTNANLTGPITSSGNTTTVTSQTGTGTTFVMNTSPTLVTPILGAATATAMSISGILSVASLSQSICYFQLTPTSVPGNVWTSINLTSGNSYGPGAPSVNAGYITINSTGTYILYGAVASAMQSNQYFGYRFFNSSTGDLGVYFGQSNSGGNNSSQLYSGSMVWMGQISSGINISVQIFQNNITQNMPYAGVSSIYGSLQNYNNFVFMKII